MKRKPTSLRRRHLMIASLVAAVAPAAAAGASAAANARAQRVIVSGRVSDAAGRPHAGLTVEVWHAHTQKAEAITDADGRFFATLAAAAHAAPPRRLACRVGRERIVTPVLGALQRDDTGTWRASFGVTLA